MRIEVNDNLKWFLESLLNENIDKFVIDDFGIAFIKNGYQQSLDEVNFLTSEMFKACPELKRDTEYSIKDFLNGEIDLESFEFGDKVIVTAGGKEYDCIYLKPKDSNSVVLTSELVTVSIPNKYIRKVK